MNTQGSKDEYVVVTAGQPLRLAGHGRLDVVAGRVWLTRSNDLDDTFVGAGQSVDVGVNDEAVVESWPDAGGAVLAWHRVGRVETLRRAWRSVLHNGAAAAASIAARRRADVSAPSVVRARNAAQEAGCGAPSAA